MTSINIAGRLVDISSPCVMAILNITPDSFFQGSRALDCSEIIKRAEQALEQGATFIDIGACSTRPAADIVSQEQEMKRLLLAINAIKSSIGTNINLSIDTFRSEVIEAVLDVWGEAVIVNDITASSEDNNMLEIVSKNSLPYIAMHGGVPHIRREQTSSNEDIVHQVIDFFVERLKVFLDYGIKDVIFDVGFGFAKTTDQNFELLSRFDEFSILNTPQLVGISRKGMIWKTLETTPENALNGTTVLNTMLLERGAKILRVHDTKQAMECITIFNKLKK